MEHLQPTRFPDLNAVLQDLVRSVQELLAANFVGAYLQGSFAGTDPDEHGDVDFLVVTRTAINGAELEGLQAMHARIFDGSAHWAKHLEGSYFPEAALRRLDPHAEPVPYLDNGSRQLIRHKHDDTLVVRWVLLDHGITLAGPHPKNLIDPVPTEALRQEVFAVMADWGHDILADPASRDNGWFQPYAVLSYCRMLQTLATGRVESKRSAATWGQATLEGRWAGLIARAWAQRPRQYTKVHQRADEADFQGTLEFIRYALEARHGFMARAPE